MYFNSIQGWKISKDDAVQTDTHITPVPADDGGGDFPYVFDIGLHRAN